MSNAYHNIPGEMQTYAQWVTWRYENRDAKKPTKVLYCPSTGHRASVTDPSTWGTFDGMVAVSHEYDGIGFVFTKGDPYVGVDLDVAVGAEPSEIQQFIYNKLDSYSETSPSGRGVHVIVKGTVPAGRNDQTLGVEVYDSGRFFTFTGNATKVDAPVVDRAHDVLELWHEIGGVFDNTLSEPYDIQTPALIDDETLVKRICASSNNKSYFDWTADFDWSNAYRSVLGAACLFSSDADQIYRVIMAAGIVTKSPPHGREARPARVRRLWAREYGYACRQGDQERADQGFRLWSQRWFPGGSREMYAELMELAHKNAQAIIATHTKRMLDEAKQARRRTNYTTGKALPVPLAAAGLLSPADLSLPAPEGVFSDLIDEVCLRTRNPSEIMATWAILGFISGSVGRAYVTTEGAGVNNFFILSAGSNTGKTQHWNALISIARVCAPKLLAHVFGGDTASPQVLAKEGQKMPSMVMRLPDAGMWLRGIMEAKTQIQAQMRSALLNIYESAGEGAEWHIPKSIRSNNDGNESLDEFNCSIVLDTTPQYVSDFDLSDFTDGLMSRFIMVYGPEVISDLQVPKRGDDIPDNVAMAIADLQQMAVSVARPINVNTMGGMGVPARIVVTHKEGLTEYMWELEKEITATIRDVQSKRLPPHYIAASRVVLNAKRVAAIVAMINDPLQPVITREIFDYALRFVLSSATSIITMFDEGTMGSDESKQEAAILDYLERIIRANPDKPYVTLSALGKHVDKLACFSKAKMGARYTRQRVISDLLERDVIVKMTVQGNTRPTSVITFSANST